MEKLFIAADSAFIGGINPVGHLQIVYDDGSGELIETEVQAPGDIGIIRGNWKYIFGDPHNEFPEGEKYAIVEVTLNEGQSAKYVWELLEQVHDSLAASTTAFDIDYNTIAFPPQNSNSYIKTLLDVVGISVDLTIFADQGFSSFPGFGRNVLQNLSDISDNGVPLSVAGTNGIDIIYGGNNADTLNGSGGSDVINGGSGEDNITGGWGHDSLNGDDGDDFIDFLYGQGGNDTIYGGSGDDDLDGSSGHDILIGGEGIDALFGGTGNDQLNGNEGNDFLYGQGGNDIIFGGSGNDQIEASSGHDTIRGGSGNDVSFGGTGSDTYVWLFEDIFDGITNFVDAIGDFSSVDILDFTALGLDGIEDITLEVENGNTTVSAEINGQNYDIVVLEGRTNLDIEILFDNDLLLV